MGVQKQACLFLACVAHGPGSCEAERASFDFSCKRTFGGKGCISSAFVMVQNTFARKSSRAHPAGVEVDVDAAQHGPNATSYYSSNKVFLEGLDGSFVREAKSV